jgi:prephenate dehydratase
VKYIALFYTHGGIKLTIKIGYLGPKGTFTEMAAKKLFLEGNFISYTTIAGCIEAIENEVDFSVVPIENTIEGSVPITLDYLYHQKLFPIIAELNLTINQHLMVHPNTVHAQSNLKSIYSHSHALSQCYQFIYKNFPSAEMISMNSTGEAAKYVAENANELVGAIGNELAAKLNGLTIIERNIQDYPNNQTRFIVLSKNRGDIPINNLEYIQEKATFMITPKKNVPGSLHQILSAFAWRKLDLSKIESRPLKTGFGNYFFILDVNQPTNKFLLTAVKEELESLNCKVDILGCFPCYQ